MENVFNRQMQIEALIKETEHLQDLQRREILNLKKVYKNGIAYTIYTVSHTSCVVTLQEEDQMVISNRKGFQKAMTEDVFSRDFVREYDTTGIVLTDNTVVKVSKNETENCSTQSFTHDDGLALEVE